MMHVSLIWWGEGGRAECLAFAVLTRDKRRKTEEGVEVHRPVKHRCDRRLVILVAQAADRDAWLSQMMLHLMGGRQRRKKSSAFAGLETVVFRPTRRS